MSASAERGEPGAPSAAGASAAEVSAAAIALEGSDGLGELKGSGGVAATVPAGGTGTLGGGECAAGGASPSPSPFRASPRATPTLTRSHTLGPSASTLEKEKRERPSALGRVFNPPKLERKHSSGDLHSRLKTRKILGVGETDNGDIHRSKISQVLGHNEHLYVRLPRGFWSAHVLMGAGVTVETLLLLLFPGIAAHLGVMPPDMTEADDDPQGAGVTASRVAGAALAGLCVFVWSLLGTSDKHYARTMLLSMLTYHILSICVGAASAFTQQNEDEALLENRLVMIIGMRAVMCLICLAYFYSIAGYTPIRGQKPSGFRQPSQGPKEH